MKHLPLVLISVLYASVAGATPITLTAVLDGSNEIPPVASPATGQATLTLDPVAETLQLSVSFSGLTSPDTAAVIHCCLTVPLEPANVGVATTIPAFPGFPLGVLSGTYVSQVFDLTQPLIYDPAFVTAEGGLHQAETALVTALLNSETYLNIHTESNPGGEIRGFISPESAAVPEPATLLLLGTGLAGVSTRRWRNRRQRD